MKKSLAVLLTASMVASLAACGGGSKPAETTAAAAAAETAAGETAAETEAAPAEVVHDGSKIFKTVESFPYPSLDIHKDYYSWHTQFYGITESLFKINDDLSITGWLAEGMDVDGCVNTITLKDGICFSTGTPVTAEAVIKCWARLAENNNRYTYLNDFTIEAKDDKTIVITTPASYPTLINELASAETGIIDVDATTDFDAGLIGTGPFVVDEFIPEGDLTTKYNENYWDGDVLLDGAIFYAMGDEESKLMAMQNGEIDGYVDISASSREIYETDPESYTVTVVPTQRRAYALINNKIPQSVRDAIMVGVDKEQIALYLNGLVSAASGAFSPETEYGSVQAPTYDVAKAKEILEADGYALNGNGIYEKDGQPLSYTISCYKKRSVDTIALVFQEQLKAIGIETTLGIVEDPDGTYMSTKDFEIAMYVMITDKAGEPSAFLNGAIKSGSYQDVCGYGNETDDALIEELRYETDSAKRAALADEIMTHVYAGSNYDFLVQYNKSSVLRAGASGLSESNPLQYYGLTAKSNLE